MFYSSAASDRGLVRSNNEDNFFLHGEIIPDNESVSYKSNKSSSSDKFLAAVFDGMGGENAGEKASFAAAAFLASYYDSILATKGDIHENIKLLEEYVDRANRHIYELADKDEEKSRMGTTFAGLFISEKKAVALNLGDSRVYLYRSGNLTQLSEDHTEAERLVRIGAISREQSRTSKGRYMLNRHLGVSPEEGKMEASISEILDLEDGDMFLLCSDGLTDMIQDDEIKTILGSSDDTDIISRILVDTALKNGGKDNVTVIVTRHSEIKNDKEQTLPIYPRRCRRKQKSSIKKKLLLICTILLIVIVLLIIFSINFGIV